MTPLRRALQVASVAGLVMFMLVRVETTEANGEKTRRLAVGLPFSPWVWEERAEGPGNRFRLEREVTFLSWSWLCLLPAFLFTYREARTGTGGRRGDDETRSPEADVHDPR